MLALDGTRVKLSKRKLRLERCKSAAAKALAAHKAAKEAALREKAEARTKDRRAANKTPIGFRKPVVVPTRPDIGDQLKDLPKSDRKALKSSDDERLARRLAKKNSKRQEIGMIKAKEALDRRVKTAGGGGVGMRPKSAAKEGAKRKTRSRSDNLVFKKNTKKTTE
jgi:nucleolar protein 12